MGKTLVLEPRIPQDLSIKFNVASSLHPVDAPDVFQMFGAYEGPHAPVVECFLLPEVTDINLDLLVFMVFDSKVKPLQVTARIGIDSHEQVILVRTNLHHCVKVPALEVRVEQELLVEVYCGVHPFE
jgi:hypothetical protein